MAGAGAVNEGAPRTRIAFAVATSLFFAWGFINANTEPLIAALRVTFALTYTEALSTHLVFFAAFGIISLPTAALLNRIGAANAILTALATMIVGCLVVQGTTRIDSFPAILVGLFVLGSGITILQVAANPLTAVLGPPQRSHFRLTLAQAFNSLGVVLGAQAGSRLMLGRNTIAVHGTALGGIANAFLVIAGLLICVFGLAWLFRHRFDSSSREKITEPGVSVTSALRSRWAVFGAIAIACYVGAEVSIGAMMINFLHRPDIMDVELATAGSLYLAPIYWGGALTGRFLGSALLTRMSAPRLLTMAAVAAAGLCLIAIVARGPTAGWAALAVGLFNSIMFPTIFSITLGRASAPQAATSGLLCLAIAGGGLLPLAAGLTVDRSDLSSSFAIPMAAYLLIVLFATTAMRFDGSDRNRRLG